MQINATEPEPSIDLMTRGKRLFEETKAATTTQAAGNEDDDKDEDEDDEDVELDKV